MAERAARLKLEIYKGEDWVQPFTEYQSGAVDAAVRDITGWTISATVKAQASDTNVVLAVLGTLTDPSNGAYEIAVNAADSSTLSVRTYAIDVWRTNAGAKTCLAKGTLKVLQPVRTPA